MERSSEGKSRALKRFLAVYSCFLLLTSWIYWDALPALPNADQLNFSFERLNSTSDWDFFVRALSFDRTRILNPGNVLLFRPLSEVYTALCDIFLHTHLRIYGYLSFTFHALCLTLLYLILLRFTDKKTALLGSGLLLVEYAGHQLILTRHVSCYLFPTACFLAALLSLPNAPSEERRPYCVSVFFLLLASFGLEMFSFGLSLAVVFLWLSSTKPKHPYFFLLAPFLIYCSVSLLDYSMRDIPQPFGRVLFDFNILNFSNVYIRSIGKSFLFFLFPGLISFQLKVIPLELAWKATTQWTLLEPVSFALGLCLFTILVVLLVRWRKPGNQIPPYFPYSIGMLAATLALLTAGRLVPRGGSEAFLDQAHYLYLTNVCFILLVVPWILRRFTGQSSKLKPLGLLLIASWFLVRESQSWQKLEARMQLTKAEAQAISDRLNTVRAYLDKNPGSCFAGFLDPNLFKLPRENLIRESCVLKPGHPFYAQLTPLDGLAFRGADTLETKEYAPDFLGAKLVCSYLNVRKGNLELSQEKYPHDSPGVKLSEAIESPDSVELTFMPEAEHERLALIVGYKDPKNYIFIGFPQRQGLTVFQTVHAKKKHRLLPRALGFRPPATVGLQLIDGKVYLLKDKLILFRLEGMDATSLTGKFGVAHCPRANEPLPLQSIKLGKRKPASPALESNG